MIGLISQVVKSGGFGETFNSFRFRLTDRPTCSLGSLVTRHVKQLCRKLFHQKETKFSHVKLCLKSTALKKQQSVRQNITYKALLLNFFLHYSILEQKVKMVFHTSLVESHQYQELNLNGKLCCKSQNRLLLQSSSIHFFSKKKKHPFFY